MPRNKPGSTSQYLSVNVTGEIATGRHALRAAVDAANTLGVEQGSGQGVARWTALRAELPDYRINSDGVLTEWAWPSPTDHYNNHAQHMYGAWPLHEFNPEDKPDLVLRARKALDLRGDEQAARGAIHRPLARARLGDGAGVYTDIKKILGPSRSSRSSRGGRARGSGQGDGSHRTPGRIMLGAVASAAAISIIPWTPSTTPAARGE